MLRRALTFYTKYFAVWVVGCGLIAFLWKDTAEHPNWFRVVGTFSLTELFPADVLSSLSPAVVGHLSVCLSMNTLFFALTMFGIGVALQPDDFRRILKTPSVVALGTAAQFLVMPFGAYAISRLFRLPPPLAVGLILTGAAPGAMASNTMSYVAKADAAYSVSLTTVSTLLCPILTPLLTKVLAGSELPVSFWAMFIQIMVMVVVPLLLGFWVRYRFRRSVERILPVFPAISATFIVFICSVVIARNQARLPQVTGSVLAVVLTLNLWGLGAGYGIGALFGLDTLKRRALTIEIGMQNAGLGSALALEHLGEEAAIPAAIFVFVCIITASALASFWQRRLDC
ncbi:MAG: bile acid:sodium symporter family protein [Sedimentisphaerales bacterium]|jgi:BASS family bile acid:Na+ symporter|nr:bile acid:sodium symporter family protein [Sedimentisphaerales bacterium]NLZ06569.1 bile acid:sodium symporter family protein [Phycisphaerae bacterium]HNY79480.1 bile acid:sodium symporter family protein [Sedimentisphaerales bacterium]HOC64614.1 bile acid:sodium symporter family protein [Sedimentisphaerales bacterium]HOH65407.1 bile acid:sodium symporter family protein [Sedimentisphaerales bacterium]